MDDEMLKAVKAKHAEAKRKMENSLESERKAIAEATGAEFEADKVAHEWNVSSEMKRTIRSKNKIAKNALLGKMDAETNEQNKKKGVTAKWDFIDRMETFLIKELKLKRDEVLEFAYADNIKKFVIAFNNLELFWKEIKREISEQDASFEFEHFNDYDNGDVKRSVFLPLNTLLDKKMSKIRKKKNKPDPEKAAKEILNLYLTLADIVFEADLDSPETPEFASVCQKLTSLDKSKNPKLNRAGTRGRGPKRRKKLNMNMWENKFGS